MGRYIDEILQPGEKVLYSTNAHWMFYLPAIAAWIVAVVFLVLSRMVTADVPVLVCLSLAAIVGPASRCTGRSRPGSTAGPPRPTSPICASSTRPASSSGGPSR